MSLTYSSRRGMESDSNLPSIKAILEHYGARVRQDHGQVNLRCPFHGDTHQSGSANLDKNLFVCFACGMQGNSLQIIARQENTNINEAERIAERITGTSNRQVRGATFSGRRLPSKKRNHGGGSTLRKIRGGS